MPATVTQPARLKKELGLFDVYAISTGAMFSSGFFLLPGLAAAQAGPSVILAYLLAGLFILPAMLSMAELSTAMPRAGGAYYFLDRSLGPMIGTIGGLGTYLALTLKSAFALVGMGAYLAFFVELPIKPLAVGLTVAFAALNIIGAKETTGLQRLLVVVLLSVMAFFVAQGLFEVANLGVRRVTETQLTPFMPFGVDGLLATVGFVFVSYAGLTKVASVAEEVQKPDRNIPLGMALSLATATTIYVVGVFIIVAVLNPEELRSDLTPVATASEAFFDWLPQPLGLLLIVAAAIAAFASTGNAGLMAASRYPLAMARDRLISSAFSRLGRFRTPVRAVGLTAGLMIFSIVILDEEGIAKLASAFQLFIFMLVNFAVIVMRESRIASYDPGYRSPLYPWMQLSGIVISLVLIVYMGWLSSLFTTGLVAGCLAWYAYYARGRVVRDGAIYHWFERLGQRRYEGLDRELRGILIEKGLREKDPFDEVVTRSTALDVARPASFEAIVEQVAEALEKRLPLSADEVARRFLEGTRGGATPVTQGVALPHLRIAGIAQPQLVLVRVRSGVRIESEPLPGEEEAEQEVYALFFLVSPEGDAGLHLRILAQIAGHVDDEAFMEQWNAAEDEQELKEVLLRDERFLSLRLRNTPSMAPLLGRALREIDLPEGTLVALIRRRGRTLIPRGSTTLEAGDRLTILGDPGSIRMLYQRYVDGEAQAEAEGDR